MPRFILIAVLVIAGILYVTRAVLPLGEPLGPDEASYAIGAQKILAGGSLYTDIVSIRPPLLFTAYASWIAVCGSSELSIRLMALVLNLLGFVLLILLAYRLAGKRLAVLTFLLGALWWQTAPLTGHMPNTEIFIHITAIISAIIFLRFLARPALGVLFIAGLIAALGNLFKQMALANLAAMWLALFWVYPVRRDRGRGVILGSLVLGAAAVLPWGVVMGYYATRGMFDVFWQFNFQWIVAYDKVSSGLEPMYQRAFWRTWPFLGEVVGLLLLAGAGIFCPRPGENRARRVFLVTWLLVSGAIIVFVGRFFQHHFQALLPAGILLAAGGLSALLEERAEVKARREPRPGLAFAAMLILFAVLAWARVEAPTYRRILSPNTMEPSYQQLRVVGRTVGALTDAGDTVFVWGGAPQIYFYSGRLPAGRIMWLDSWMAASLPEWMDEQTASIVSGIETNRPRCIVVSSEEDYLRRTSVYEKLQKEYALHSRKFDEYAIYLRKD